MVLVSRLFHCLSPPQCETVGHPPNPLWATRPAPRADLAVPLDGPPATTALCARGATPLGLCRQHLRLAAVSISVGVAAAPPRHPPEIAATWDRHDAISSPPTSALDVYRGRHRQEHARLSLLPLHPTAGSRPSARSLPHPPRSQLSLCVPLVCRLRLPHATAGGPNHPFTHGRRGAGLLSRPCWILTHHPTLRQHGRVQGETKKR